MDCVSDLPPPSAGHPPANDLDRHPPPGQLTESWERAHPNRSIAQNGEINTLRGNVRRLKTKISGLVHPQKANKSAIFGAPGQLNGCLGCHQITQSCPDKNHGQDEGMYLFRKKPEKPNAKFPPFHPQTIIRDLGNGDALRLADLLTGVCMFGGTGSGKTSAGGRFVAFGLLAAGFGGLVLCAKPEERQQWVNWARECGREDDLVIVDASGKNQFNFMEWESSRPTAGGGLSINIVNMLDEIATAISGASEGGANSKFWEQSLSHMNTNLVDLALLAGEKASLPLLRSILTTAPLSPEQILNEDWQTHSVCAIKLDAADRKTANADPNIRASFEQVRDYWLLDFPNLNEKTRSIITLTFSMLVRPLITPPLRQIFSDTTNIQPEDTFDGKIIICDLSVQEYRLVGRIANLIFKYTFQTAVLRRVQPADRKSFLRPVFLWSDEFQEFISKFDSSYQAVARSAGGCSVLITQNRESLRRALKNNDAVDSLLGNAQCKFFFQNTGDTNEYAAKLLGEHWLNITSTNVGQSQNDLAQQQPQNNAGNHSSGVSRSQQRRYFVEPARFTTLKRGGANNDYIVEAILYNGGNLFGSGPNALPCRLITFKQI